MTERERWIVYPLLFLALGASLRDKFGGPETIDAKHIHCEELRTSQVVIADPRSNQPRIVLKTVPEAAPNGAVAPHSSGQIELLDPAQRVQTAITRGAVITHGLKTQAIAVADPLGRPRVQMGTKPETSPEGKNSIPATSGWIEVYGKDNTPIPIVRLAASPDGGYVFARRDDVPIGVVTGNFPQGSGMFLQIGDRQIPLHGPASSDDIKKLEKLIPKEPADAGKPPTKKPEPHSTEQGKPDSTESPKAGSAEPAKP